MDPLAQLKDIHTPQGVDWWPLAWGWWALAVIAIVLLIMVVMLIVKQVRFNRARREAIKLHNAMSADAQYPAAANQLLKRVTLHYFDNALTASAYGSTWLSILTSCLSARYQAKTTEGLTLLAASGYQPTPLNEQQVMQIQEAVGLWLKHANLKRPVPSEPLKEANAHV